MVMSSGHLLDPGVPARKPSSYCKFCLCIGFVLFGLLLATYTYLYGFRKFDFAALPRFSHSQIFQNQTLEQVENRGTVVRPLVDDNQSFDIAVSIWVDVQGRITETPLYSDIVFQGLQLADKHKSASIRYTLPVAMFRDRFLVENGLRASNAVTPSRSFVAVSFTPITIRDLNPSFSGFPLGAIDKGPPTVADKALDSFGISMPHLEFHGVGGKCTGASTALKHHPFVVTRTQIQVVDETHVFNRELYNKEHNKLRFTSCGQGKYNVTILELCNRDYFTNGNWETRLELQTTDQNTGESQTEWAYAPYLGHAPSAAGPKDIVAVPVTRENCTLFENPTSTDPDSIEINWQLSYSGRSPLKYFSASLIPPERVPHNESDFKKAMAQDRAELMNGLTGHRFYEDAHPRRRFFLDSSITLLYLIQASLTRATGTPERLLCPLAYRALCSWHSAESSRFSPAHPVTVEKVKADIPDSNWLLWLWLAAVTVAFDVPQPLFMLKTVTRLAFSRSKTRWVVSLRRLGGKGWNLCLTRCLDYIGFNYYSFSPFDHLILAANHPPLGPNDGLRLSELIPWAFAWIHLPLRFTGLLSQLLLNQRSKIYGGSYKITAALHCICGVLELLKYVPSVTGRYDARPGLSVSRTVTEEIEDENSE
ncbi:hypothetical protein C8J57DRAFT_1712255 [Mycena rebaudengoi]|nr:hypothetical protein C8J57DRAFT_1712255 [Mycena rebaudengoi]